MMADADGQSRTFRVTPEDISAADTWIEDVGRRWGIPERTTFRARICVAEIAANVLKHGASPTGSAEFGVTLRQRGEGLDVEITDSGLPFDPTAAPEREIPRTLDEAQIGGFGLHLVRSYAEDISYRHDGVRNRLRLHLPAAAS
jgi:anti-sigma regulatory factor (Ser/Thr protein kinase)